VWWCEWKGRAHCEAWSLFFALFLFDLSSLISLRRSSPSILSKKNEPPRTHTEAILQLLSSSCRSCNPNVSLAPFNIGITNSLGTPPAFRSRSRFKSPSIPTLALCHPPSCRGFINAKFTSLLGADMAIVWLIIDCYLKKTVRTRVVYWGCRQAELAWNSSSLGYFFRPRLFFPVVAAPWIPWQCFQPIFYSSNPLLREHIHTHRAFGHFCVLWIRAILFRSSSPLAFFSSISSWNLLFHSSTSFRNTITPMRPLAGPWLCQWMIDTISASSRPLTLCHFPIDIWKARSEGSFSITGYLGLHSILVDQARSKLIQSLVSFVLLNCHFP